MIESVATLVAARQIQRDVQRLQARQSTLGHEIATGSKADIAGELGGRTPILIGLRDAHARTERYLETSATLATRLETMQLALSGIRDAGGQLGLEALAAVGRSDVTSLRNVQTSAEATLDLVVRHLNSSVAGRHLFSGTLVDTAPMLSGAGPSGVIDAVIADATAAAGGQLDVADIAGLVADLDAVFDDSHPDPARRFSTAFYQGAPTSEPDLTGQLDEGARLTYGLKGNHAGFRDVLQGLHMLAAVRFGDPGMTEQAYRDFAHAAVDRLHRGLDRLIDLAAQTGQNQARVATNQERLQIALDLYNREIVELERRDPYEAATLLATVQQQLEASFLITARMSQLSLTAYLR